MTSAARTRAATRCGATAIETTLVLSCTMLMLLGVFEFGRLIMIRNVLINAAREGARQATANTDTLTTADISNTVTKYMVGQSLPNFQVTVYQSDANGNNVGAWNNTQFGNYIAVQITANYTPMVPSFGILPSTVPLSVRSIMHSEAN